jgi:hypothetical protein
LDLARYLTESVAALDDIRAIETAPIIRTVKRAGALLPIDVRSSGPTRAAPACR